MLHSIGTVEKVRSYGATVGVEIRMGDRFELTLSLRSTPENVAVLVAARAGDAIQFDAKMKTSDDICGTFSPKPPYYDHTKRRISQDKYRLSFDYVERCRGRQQVRR